MAELQPEVPDMILPSEALKDTAPVLEGLKVTAAAHARPGGKQCWSKEGPAEETVQGLLRKQGRGGHSLA